MIEKLGSGGFSPPVTIETAPGIPQERLYNMNNDLAEVNELAKAHPKKLVQLKRELDSIRGL